MLLQVLKGYADDASDGTEVGIAVRSIETGEIVVTYAVVADINEYGELIISVAI